jgi:2-polyprenyl-3-methyl-5-hydroxy-6-metoxy-1,4-benzoquinol methylase
MNTEPNISGRDHWEKIYGTKTEKEVSWFQPYPTVSMKFIDSFNLPWNAAIIDIGTGDGLFIETLLDKGYRNISALDISRNAIERAKTRLGEKAAAINWIVSDILSFDPTAKFDLWHDRATFHFLTHVKDVDRYISIAADSVKANSYMLLSTFSEQGPKKCSGLDIRQYSETSLSAKLDLNFEKLNCIQADHTTPFNTVQNFLFCAFKKRNEPYE